MFEKNELKLIISKFVNSNIPNYRNLLRFVIPNKNIFEDSEILLLARALHFADSWKEQDKEYERLKGIYQGKLQSAIGSAFSKVLIVSQWDHQNPHNINFETIDVDGEPSQMFSKIDEKIEHDHFSIDDFKALILDAVKSKNIERQKLSNLRKIIEEPRPFPNAVIPWTRPSHIFDVIVDGVMNGQYAMQTNSGIIQISSSKDSDQVRRELTPPQWNRWDSLHVVETSGDLTGTGIPEEEVTQTSSNGTDSPGPTPPGPTPPSEQNINKQPRDLGFGQAPLQILDSLERWGVSKETKLHDVSLVFTSLSGKQLRTIIQSFDSEMPDSEINLKLIQEEDGE